MRTITKNRFKQFNPNGKEDLAKWRKIFVDSGDPTEYEAAITLLGSWEEWQIFKRDWPAFRDTILPEWLTELEIRIRSKAIKKMVDAADNKLDTGAMKWIAEGKYKPAEEKKRGKDWHRERAIKKGVSDELDDIARVEQANVVKLERTK